VTNINTVAISAGYEWDSATVANRDPIQNILTQERDRRGQLRSGQWQWFPSAQPEGLRESAWKCECQKRGQFYTSDVTANGRVGKLLGLNVIVSNVVTADYAMVGIAQECGTWRAAHRLRLRQSRTKGFPTQSGHGKSELHS